MRISLYVVAALAAISIMSSSVSAAPMRVGSFGGGHFGHFRSFGFHPGFDHRLAGDHFLRGGRGRFFGGGLGLFAYGDDFGSDYGSPGVINSSFSGVRVEVGGGGGGGAPMADGESHGDCLFHKLIYNADGHYVGQKTSRACY
jgi:hypothetical protein